MKPPLIFRLEIQIIFLWFMKNYSSTGHYSTDRPVCSAALKITNKPIYDRTCCAKNVWATIRYVYLLKDRLEAYKSRYLK